MVATPSQVEKRVQLVSTVVLVPLVHDIVIEPSWLSTALQVDAGPTAALVPSGHSTTTLPSGFSTTVQEASAKTPPSQPGASRRIAKPDKKTVVFGCALFGSQKGDSSPAQTPPQVSVRSLAARRRFSQAVFGEQ